MRFRYLAIIACGSLILVACAEVKTLVSRASSNVSQIFNITRDTMSGVTVVDVKDGVEDAVGEMVDGAKYIKNDAEERIDNISEGLDKIKEGKELIDKGLGREEGVEQE